VDYRLPVAGNVFYKRWSDLQASSSIGEALDSIDVLAAERFVILLECPTDGETGLPSGYHMDLTAPRTTSDVARLFWCEITARLVVLWNLILASGEDVTPLYWLHYILSAEEGRRI
jgi:hypothetical protein